MKKGISILLNLYQLISKENNNFTIKLANSSHPIFKAHFPNNPLLPGFMQIDIASEILSHKIKKIIKAKFISTAMPEDKLLYEVRRKDKLIKLIIKKESKKISEISYEIF